MAEFIAHNMAPIMFASLVVFLLLGYPVAFSLAAVGIIYFIVGVELAPLSHGEINLYWPLLQSLPERLFGIMNNDVLLAIPFFTFMGLVLERSGMAEDLLDTIGQMFGTVRGGLAYAVIFVGALLAATTGVVAASVISMGLISLPIMLRYGYDRRVASGVIAASGTLAQIIPPSLVLIVMADQLGRSVGDMYEGAFIPGVVLACLYAFYIFIVTNLSATAAPGLPPDAVGFREPDGNRGLRSLAILAVASGVLGYFLMRDQPYRGADFVDPDDGGGHCDRILSRRVELDRLQDHRVAVSVASRPASDFRHGAPAVSHIPGAGHDFHRRGDADRRWRNGRHRFHHSRRVQAVSSTAIPIGSTGRCCGKRSNPPRSSPRSSCSSSSARASSR